MKACNVCPRGVELTNSWLGFGGRGGEEGPPRLRGFKQAIRPTLVWQKITNRDPFKLLLASDNPAPVHTHKAGEMQKMSCHCDS